MEPASALSTARTTDSTFAMADIPLTWGDANSISSHFSRSYTPNRSQAINVTRSSSGSQSLHATSPSTPMEETSEYFTSIGYDRTMTPSPTAVIRKSSVARKPPPKIDAALTQKLTREGALSTSNFSGSSLAPVAEKEMYQMEVDPVLPQRASVREEMSPSPTGSW